MAGRWRSDALPVQWIPAMLWGMIAAIWIGIGAAAPELIWQGLKIALANPSWADLVSAVMIGLILAFFIEPILERVRDMLDRPSHPTLFDRRSHQALFAISLSFLFAVISVALHDAMIAIVTGRGPGHAANGSGLTTAILLAAEWAIVPLAIMLAWLGAGAGWVAVPLGIVGAASPFAAGWLFAWPLATTVTTAIPCLIILALGYGEMQREPTRQAFVRCARRVVVVAALWLPIALVIDILGGHPGEFYGMTDFLVDIRFYLGWAIALVLVPWSAAPAARAERMAP